MKPFQQSLFIPATRQSLTSNFGGSLLVGKRKGLRPVATRKAMHIVLRSSQAVGNKSMLKTKHYESISYIIKKQSKTFGIKIHSFVNVGNHLHILLQAQNRYMLVSFLRAISGLIARQMTGLQRGPHRSANKQARNEVHFWDQRPFSRIVDWGKAFKIAKEYLNKNFIESIGFGRWVPIDIFDSTA